MAGRKHAKRRPRELGDADHMDHDAIRTLARDCARHCLNDTPCGAKLVCDGAPEYFGCLEQLLGRPYTELEGYEFRSAFDAAVAVERPEASA